MVVYNNVLAGAAGSGGADAYTIQRSLRFNRPDTPSLSKTFSSAGNQSTWTWSAWVKRAELTTTQSLFTCYTGTDNNDGYVNILFNGADKLSFSGWTTSYAITDAVFRDTSAWYHIVIAVDQTQSNASDRIKVYVNGVAQTFSTYNASRSTYPVNSASLHHIGSNGYYNTATNKLQGYLAEIHFVDGQQLAPTDFGESDADTDVWNPIEYTGTYGTNGFHLDFSDNSSNAALGYDAAGSNNWTVNNILATTTTTNWASQLSVNNSNNSIIDPGNAFDGNLTTYARLNLEQGGDRGIVWTPATTTTVSSSLRVYWKSWTSTTYNNGYVYVNGQSQGQVPSNQNGWYTVSFTGTINTLELRSQYNSGGGHHIDWVAIEVDGSIIKDAGPEEIDSLRDSPTNYEADSGNNGGNYCTWNSLDKDSNVVLSNGNLEASPSGGTWSNVRGTIGVSSSKWYWEIKIDSLVAQQVGVATNSDTLGNWFGNVSGGSASQGAVIKEDGQVMINSSVVTTLSSFSAGDIIGIALDLDGNTIQFYKNGSSNGSAVSLTGGRTYFPIAILYGSTDKQIANFGQRPFAYTPPTGFKSLCTQNLDDPLIADPSTAFDVDLYTGTGASHTRSGFSFSPDLVWIKVRSAGSSHRLFDTVRGAGKHLTSSGTGVEETHLTSLSGFTSDGFTLGANGEGATNVNQSGGSYVGWLWDAGSSNTSISVGSLNSSSYNSSRVWSNDWTANVYYSTYNATKVFDGDNSTGVAVTYPSTSTNIAVSPAISGSVIRVLYSKDNSSTVGTINGSETLPSTGSSATYVWRTLAATSISSIQLAHDNSGSSYIRAIEVDGKILLDQGVSAVDNFPSIASTCRTNQTAGISIVSWTGAGASGAATVGHNLNGPVDFMIIKRRSGGSASWPVWWSAFESSGTSDYFFLDAADAKGINTYDFWNNLTPTSSLFHISSNANLNAQNDPMIGYIFSSVDGFSKFGKYQGGASPFVYTGFRPAFVAIKGAHSSHWVMMDAARDPFNDLEKHLHPNLSNAEATAADRMDFLSNGFKIRANYGESGDSYTYYYLAFAESPFKYSRAR